MRYLIIIASLLLYACTRSSYHSNNANWIFALLSLADIGLAALMCALGVLSLIEMDVMKNVSEAFLASYMILFAGLLFVYEFVWWQPIAALNKTFRKNFGFMYGLRGKGFYLIFIAFLCLGLWKDDTATPVEYLDILTGLAWLACGCLHVFMGCCWPDINSLYKPATAGLTEPSSPMENPV